MRCLILLPLLAAVLTTIPASAESPVSTVFISQSVLTSNAATKGAEVAVEDAHQATTRLRRLKTAEVTPELLNSAYRLIREHYHRPVGTEILVEAPTGRYIARLERHYHPEGGPVKPWGYHPGISLFAVVTE